MEMTLVERLVRVEVLAVERQATTELQLQELRADAKQSNETLQAMLRKHTEEEMVVMIKLLATLEDLTAQSAKVKGMVGGIILTVSSIWFVLTQFASWLHLDFIKLLSSALGK